MESGRFVVNSHIFQLRYFAVICLSVFSIWVPSSIIESSEKFKFDTVFPVTNVTCEFLDLDPISLLILFFSLSLLLY